MTLEPGDIIATGTPAGVGNSRDPQLFLGPGDVVEVGIARPARSATRVSMIGRAVTPGILRPWPK